MLLQVGDNLNLAKTAYKYFFMSVVYRYKSVVVVVAAVVVQCCFTFKETLRTIRDREPRTSTSIFTQLLNSNRHR